MRLERLERRRDNQQWVLDYVVQEKGRDMLFDHEGRTYPPSVKSYRMIPKHMARQAKRKEDMARAAEERGHYLTALELYFAAVEDYHRAEHVIYQDDNPQKVFYYNRMAACYDKVVQHNEYPIEKVEVPWEGTTISCLCHWLPSRQKGPTILFIPGMDMVKESFPNPMDNPFLKRGMHLVTMDGPGQGISTMRKVYVTDNNYERAASAVISYLLTRPEVDPQQFGALGMSMGSFWAIRTAAHDSRLKAVAAVASCFGSKLPIFELASPRFKQIFMYMSGIHDEVEFDRMAARMTCLGYGAKITCPTLLVAGEYDQLNYVEDTLAIFEELNGPKEMWLMEDDSHATMTLAGMAGLDARTAMADWLKDALAGKVRPGHRKLVLVPRNRGKGPYGEAAKLPLGEDFYF